MKQMIFNKYSVQEIARERSMKGFVAYKLFGPKITYTLVRNQVNPHIMFCLNSKGKVYRLGGYQAWTDKRGIVEPAL